MARFGRHAIFERSRGVDRARENVVAFALVHWETLARDRCLIDRRRSPRHDAVERNALPRAHAHRGSLRHARDRHGDPASIVLTHGRSFRGEFQQTTNRIAGAMERLGLDRLGQREEEHHHGRFRPMSDEHRACHRNRHQRVDIEIAMPQGDPALLVRRQAAAEDGHQRERKHGPMFAAVEPIHGFGHRRRDPSKRNQPPAGSGCGLGSANRALCVIRFDRGFEADGLDAVENGVQSPRTMG